jgi:hypothetical protein
LSGIWGGEAKRPVRAMSVVVVDEHPQHALEVWAACDQQPVEALPAHVPTKRSAIAFALGAPIGVRTTSAPSTRKISSKAAVNLAS